MTVTRINLGANENHVNEERGKLLKALDDYKDFFGEPFNLRTPIHAMCSRSMANIAWFLRFEIQFRKAEIQQKREEIRVV
jgi:hypothetical protein